MREFFTSQEKRDLMLLSAISIFVVIIIVITIILLRLFSMSFFLKQEVASSKASFSIFVEIIRIFVMVKAATTWWRIFQLLTATTCLFLCFVCTTFHCSNPASHCWPCHFQSLKHPQIFLLVVSPPLYVRGRGLWSWTASIIFFMTTYHRNSTDSRGVVMSHCSR